MIKEFENLTAPLTDDEIKLVDVMVNAFYTMKRGKSHAITSTKIIECFKSINLEIDGITVRKIIHYIRNNNLIYGLCSGSSGYYVAENAEEFLNTLKSLQDRIRIQVATFICLKRQYKTMYETIGDTI